MRFAGILKDDSEKLEQLNAQIATEREANYGRDFEESKWPSSVVVAFLAGDKKIVAVVKEFAEKEDIKTTAITEYELLKHKNALKKQVAEEFLSEITVQPFDRASAKKAAAIYEKLREAGKMINESDLVIAGIALAADEVLLTRDQKFNNLDDPNIKVV